jgi:predicted regulator of amino acid metabolism with ACT domain
MTEERNRIDITRELYPELSFLSVDEDKPIIMSNEEIELTLSKIARETHINNQGIVNRSWNIQSMQELNKMRQNYNPDITSLQDNRQINIYISGEDAKSKLDRLLTGAKPGSLIEQSVNTSSEKKV